MKVLEMLWRMLPDKCEMPDCARRGVRGNENRIRVDGKDAIVCDGCWSRLLEQRQRETRRVAAQAFTTAKAKQEKKDEVQHQRPGGDRGDPV